MRTSCTHCGKHFKVPDKTLGKQARCKACGEMFVIAPAPGEELVELEEAVAPSRPQPEVSDDPLDALADAAVESGSHMQPVHGRATHGSSSSTTRHRDDDDDHGPRHRMARGAKAAMTLGIISTALAVGGGVCAVIAMVKGDDETLLITLGLIGVGLLVVGAVLAMMAVSSGTTAGRQIRHARHPLGGRSEASTGTLMGWVSLGLVLIAIVSGAIWMSQRGGIVFQNTVDAEGNPTPSP